MVLLKTITDYDLAFETNQSASYEDRTASRAVVFDGDGNVALLNVSKKRYHKLPGGGLERGESLIEGLKREVMEEIGCRISSIQELGRIEEYRSRLSIHQMSYCFTAEVVGKKGKPKLEEDEIADGFETVWLSLEDAIRTLEVENNIENYEGKFINMRDLIFLKQVKSNK